MNSPVDINYLAQFGFKDRQKRDRIFKIFQQQSQTDLVNIFGAKSFDEWRSATHSLKSSATAIGAWAVVNICNEALKLQMDSSEQLRQIQNNGMKKQVIKVYEFIEVSMISENKLH